VTLTDQGVEAADRIAEAFQARAGQPGLAYGIVSGGRLAHARGLGERSAGGAAPDADTVFRIASMTKSFTAAAVLVLRDEGKLALDDEAAAYLPELAGVRYGAGGARPTIRNLLTMTAGLPTDDPWGDRQQGLPLDDFARLLRGGVSFAWPPGVRFEYSNLGYAVLGAVISAVSGAGYPDFVRDRLLRPLGMAGTGYHVTDFDPRRLALGYRRGEAGWAELEPDPCGAFAPMGGVFSSVADLAIWVAGFAAAFGATAYGADGASTAGGVPHPLSAASLREMQLPQVAMAQWPPEALPGSPAGSGAGSYGFGLMIAEDPSWGRIVNHSGGYPGFGSHMRWHAASGLGVAVLANSTYAGASTLGARLLDAVLRHSVPAGHGPAATFGERAATALTSLAPEGPWQQTLAARERVTGLLQHWDDAVAGRLFASNVVQDEPYQQRRRKAELLRDRIGEFRDDPRPPESDSPAHCRWWLRGERGVVQVEILLTPQHAPLVQALRLAVPPAPGSLLAERVEALVALLNDGTPAWPDSLPTSGWLDTGLVVRRFRMAAGWAGHCGLGLFRAGDGERSATVELDGEHAKLTLAVVVDPATKELHQAEIHLVP
jgi:serine-type D-Ala-D-Ala carboxypeptidase/endopeptidase